MSKSYRKHIIQYFKQKYVSTGELQHLQGYKASSRRKAACGPAYKKEVSYPFPIIFYSYTASSHGSPPWTASKTPVELDSTQAGVALAPQPWTTTTLVGPVLSLGHHLCGRRKQTCSAGKTTREGEAMGLGRRDRDGSLRRDREVVEKLF